MFAQRSDPAGSTAALASDQVAVGVVDTLTSLVAVGAVLSLVTLCRVDTQTSSR